VNKQLLVPFFIIGMLLNTYPDPEIPDRLCLKKKDNASVDSTVLIGCE
jgi:hypothetical protein